MKLCFAEIISIGKSENTEQGCAFELIICIAVFSRGTCDKHANSK